MTVRYRSLAPRFGRFAPVTWRTALRAERGDRRGSKPEARHINRGTDTHRTGHVPLGALPIQAKLRIGQGNDPCEVEADRMADRVMHSLDPAPGTQTLSGVPETKIQRQTAPEEEEEKKKKKGAPEPGVEGPESEPEAETAGEATPEAEPMPPAAEERKEEEEEDLIQADGYRGPSRDAGAALEARVERLRSGGQPLPDGVRATFEPSFGFDFSTVRIHTDHAAGATVQALGARAFTVGNDIAFGPSEFAPETDAGRHLLAHELTHVIQQSGQPVGGHRDGTVRRAPVVEADPAVGALNTAVKGDDDDVRALTENEFWAGVKLTPDDAAQLIDNLLSGATLDEDENAGLKVLNKAEDQNVLDGTLLELDVRGRFRKLLDDYHGRQYRELLEFLSQSIETQQVKAIYLDAFVAMWWVRKDEEKAIVILLERTTVADLAALLDAKNRRAELRKAIDAKDLSKRYEALAAKASEATFGGLSAQLNRIFEITAKSSVGTTTQAGETLTEEDVERLLTAAAQDLASELQDYKDELAAATAADDRDAVTEINRRFEARIEGLITQKRREFKYELRWNLEFNRGLEAAYRRQWTQADLDEIDKILAEIPPEILYANPRLRGFRRESTHPKHLGQSSAATGFIKLAGGGLTPGTTSHELGHFAHFADDQMFNDFVAISGWEQFTRQNFDKLLPDEGPRKRILRRLDRFRKHKDYYNYVKHEDYKYTYNRYDSTGTNYYRFKSDARFITAYARTDPQDDFADTFEEYLIDPEALQKAAPEKYAFMHKRVFTEFWLTQQKDRILKSFEVRAENRLKEVSDPILDRWPDGNLIDPLRRELVQELDALTEEKVDAVDAGLLTKPVPMKGSPEPKTIAERFMTRLDATMDLAVVAYRQMDDVGARADALELQFPHPLQEAAKNLGRSLKWQFWLDSHKLMVAAAGDLGRGVVIDPDAWPALDTLVAGFDASVAVLPSYLPYFSNFLDVQKNWKLEYTQYVLLPAAKNRDFVAEQELNKFPAADPRRNVLEAFIDGERKKLAESFHKIEQDLLVMLKAGTAYRSGSLPDPGALTAAYAKTIRAQSRTLLHQAPQQQAGTP